VKNREFKQLAPGCKITAYKKGTGDEHRTRWVRVAVPSIMGTYRTFAHFDCSHNQLTALRERVLGAVPAPTRAGLEALRRTGRKMSRKFGMHRELGIREFPQQYSGAKLARYSRAAENILSSGSVPRSKAKVKCFIKFEKGKIDPAKPNPDPRAIQFRSAEYCVAVGRFLKPIEHALYRLVGDGKYLPPTRCIGKGLCSRRRATLLRQKMRAFSNPVMVSIDAKRFDQHCSRELLEVEHAFYTRANTSPEFARLLSWQLNNYGTTSKGYKYVAQGKRMSGDMNTGLGNCFLMVCMVSTFMTNYMAKRVGRLTWDLLDDGDDAIVIIEEENLQLMLELIGPVFLEFGHEITVDNVSRTMEGTEWCQGRPIEYQPGKYKFVRNPAKVMSGAIGGNKYLEQSFKARSKLVNTVGLAELILNMGIPVLQSYAIALMRNSLTDEFLKMDSIDSMYYRVHNELKSFNMKQLAKRDPQPITDTARHSFFLAYGVPAHKQIQMEEMLDSWEFSLLGDEDLVCDLDTDQWAVRNPFTPEFYRLGE